MLPSTKRNVALGIFLFIVTLVVLYSYCNGNSICYTFPFFSGLERDRLMKPEVLVTSVIVQAKRPFDITTVPRKHKAKPEGTTRKQNEPFTANGRQKTVNLSGGRGEKLHFAGLNRTSLKTSLHNEADKRDNKTRVNETLDSERHLLPPSDIVGKVAEEILRKANISEEEANRKLTRVERVDKSIDKEEIRREQHGLLTKIKESRASGSEDSDKKLMRVEREDLTDEEEDENLMRESVPRIQQQAKEKLRIKVGMDSKIEDLELKHARRLGITNATSKDLQHNNSKGNDLDAATKAAKTTLPPFFVKFLNVTAKERQLVDLLHNFTENKKPQHKAGIAIGNRTTVIEETAKPEGEKSANLTVANTKTDNTRERRSHLGHSLLDALVSKLLNSTIDGNHSTGQYNRSKEFTEPFNLSRVLEKITEKGQNLADIDIHDPGLENTALLVKFLKENGHDKLHMRDNIAKNHGNNQIIDPRLSNNNSELQLSSEGTFNLKKKLFELANNIDLNTQRNNSEEALDNQSEADLAMLWLLLRQSSLHHLETFNLSHVLRDIGRKSLDSSLTTRKALKVKRDDVNSNDFGSGDRADIMIYRPILGKQKNNTTAPVFRTKRTNISLRANRTISPTNDSAKTTRIGSFKNSALFSREIGSGESGDEENILRVGACVDFDHCNVPETSPQHVTNFISQERRMRRMGTTQATNGILKFERVSCEELDPKVLLYNRIFKTGSSTTESIITNSSSVMNFDYKIGTTEDWYDKGESGPYPGLIIRKAYKKLVKYPRMAFVAHFYFRSRLNLPQAHTYINQVRHPVRRLVSHYHYLRSKNRPKHRLKEFAASAENKESLEQCFRQRHKGCRSNVMTSFFCGRHNYCRKGNWRALHKAKHNIRRYYAAVGLLEHYDIYLQILYKRLPKFFPEISSRNIGRFKYNPRYNFDDVPKDLLGEIKRANWADNRLYSFIRKRFWQQVEACSLNF